jgi:hypothetical protein
MLDRTAARAESVAMVRANAIDQVNGDPTLVRLDLRGDLAGLPLRRGPERQLSEATARLLAKAAASLQNLSSDQLATVLAAEKEWLRADRIPALMQVLTVGPEASRVVLARHLGAVPGTEASEALVQVALFDPHPDVRREAVASLARRPPAEYRGLLLRGLEFPRTIIAEHAAEALLALRQTETVPALLRLLDGPDPRAPYRKRNAQGRYVREVVRIDHKLNCLLCHPPSFRATDPARRPVPPLREPPQTGGVGYLAAAPQRNETFVRADVTYLKQDYSVMLRVNSGTRREERRFDLFVRERLATQADAAAALARKQAGATGHQKAVAFALRELTGLEPGPRAENWKEFAQRQNLAAPAP